MNREEKNLQSLGHILESALREFSQMGYGLSSINTICNSGGISKGNLYHHFKDKDAVYLACVQKCFDSLVSELGIYAGKNSEDPRELLEGYFDARFAFFQKNPSYQRLFCEAVISPPRHLMEKIREIRADFDRLSLEILENILDHLRLRPDIRREEVAQVFRQYQDFINASYTGGLAEKIDTAEHEGRCRRAMDILLYGIVERGGAGNG